MSIKIPKIDSTRNLLAFSGGVDSSALFFILLEHKIPFDIAIVNYNVREQSKEEIEYAKQLAKQYKKKIYIHNVKLEKHSNFEQQARQIRYSFFEEIIQENSYESLITAHQLNDKLEWFLMQFSKGAGLVELLSFEESTRKDNYTILKPLINTSRENISNYINENKIKHFIDETNSDEKFKRNYFRKNFSNRFIQEFEDGVKSSFEYMQKDLESLNINFETIKTVKKLEIYEALNDDNLNIRIIDNSLKKRGFLLSKQQRDEILKQRECVISHKIAISITNKHIFISPKYNETMTKEFKEKCRIKKLPKNIRSYIFKEDIFEEINDI